MPISKIKSSAIDANAITGAGIADGTVDTADLANDAVTSAKIAAGAVTSAKLDTNIAIDGTLTVGDGSGQETLTILSDSTNEGRIRFADGTSGAAAYQGRIEYDHNTGKLNMGAGGTTPFTIDSNGHFGFGNNSPQAPIDATVAAGADWVARFQNTTSATPYNVQIYDAPSGASGYPLLQVTNSAGSQQYFRVDSGTGKISAGKMTYFVASGPTGWFTFSNGGNTKIDYTGEILDAAGTYDASTSRFTATTPGWYRFEHHMYARLAGSQGDNSNYWWGGFLKNGAAVALNGVTQNITGYQNDGDYDNFSIATAYLNLSTGDYVEAYGRSAGPSNGEVYRGHSLFVGQQLIV